MVDAAAASGGRERTGFEAADVSITPKRKSQTHKPLGVEENRDMGAVGRLGAPARRRGHQSGPKSKSGAPAATEAPEMIGGPSRTRTLDPLIKSQLLYQLS